MEFYASVAANAKSLFAELSPKKRNYTVCQSAEFIGSPHLNMGCQVNFITHFTEFNPACEINSMPRALVNSVSKGFNVADE